MANKVENMKKLSSYFLKKIFGTGIFTLILLTFFIYQFITLNIDYTQFGFNVQLVLEHIKYIPSVTFCFRQNFLESEKYFKTKTLKDILRCRFLPRGRSLSKECYAKYIYYTLKSNTTKHNKCFTVLNDHNETKNYIEENYRDIHFNIATYGIGDYIMQIHQNRMPAFFANTKRFKVQNFSSMVLDLHIIRHELLPTPYSTDCSDYTNE